MRADEFLKANPNSMPRPGRPAQSPVAVGRRANLSPLTATLQMEDSDADAAAMLEWCVEDCAGELLCEQYPRARKAVIEYLRAKA